MAFRHSNNAQIEVIFHFRISPKIYKVACKDDFLDMSVFERVLWYIWNNMHLPQTLLSVSI